MSSDQVPQIEESLLKVKEDGTTAVVIVNNSSLSCLLSKGMELGQVSGVEVAKCIPQVPVLTERSLSDDSTNNCGEMQQRSTKTQLSEEDYLPLETLLTDYHDVFSLEEDERGEIDMVEINYPESKQQGEYLMLPARKLLNSWTECRRPV